MRALALAVLLLAPAAAAQDIPLVARDLKDLQALARQDSNDAETQFYLALAYWKRHKWTQVDSLLRLTITLEPQFAEAYLALYYLPYSQRPALLDEEERGRVPQKWRQAVDDARHNYQLAFRTDPLVNLRVIRIAFEIEEPQALDMSPAEYLAYQRYFAWLVDLGMGRYGSAYDRLTRLAQREFNEAKHPEKVPDYILWYRGLAAAHSRQYDKAIVDFRTLLDRTTKRQRDSVVTIPLSDNEYRFMLGALNHLAGHADSAAAMYRAALEHDIGLTMAHTYLAGLYEQAGMAEEGLVERQRAAEVAADDPATLFAYAAALFNLNKTADAEDPLRRAIAANARYAPPQYLLGRVAEELGRRDDAREHYTAFLAIAPHRLADLIEDSKQRLTALGPKPGGP